MFNYQKFGSGENSQIEVTNSLDVMQQFQWQTISGLYLIARNMTVTLTPEKTKSNRMNGLSYLIVLKTDLWSQGTLRNGREEINFFFISFFLVILDSCNQNFFRGFESKFATSISAAFMRESPLALNIGYAKLKENWLSSERLLYLNNQRATSKTVNKI